MSKKEKNINILSRNHDKLKLLKKKQNINNKPSIPKLNLHKIIKTDPKYPTKIGGIKPINKYTMKSNSENDAKLLGQALGKIMYVFVFYVYQFMFYVTVLI